MQKKTIELRKSYVQIDKRDNVAVAINDIPKGTVAQIGKITVTTIADIQSKHKFALNNLEPNDQIRMYGVLVGRAITAIKKGEPITTQNMAHASSNYSKERKKRAWSPPNVSQFRHRTFQGYPRVDGSFGTANIWLVIPLTFCENRNVEVLEAILLEKLGYPTKRDFSVNMDSLVMKYKQGAPSKEILETPILQDHEHVFKNRLFPNVDGIKFLRHDGGCGGTREDAQVLCNLLAGYITNPNVAGATVLSLGCQNAQIKLLQKAIASKDPDWSKRGVLLGATTKR